MSKRWTSRVPSRIIEHGASWSPEMSLMRKPRPILGPGGLKLLQMEPRAQALEVQVPVATLVSCDSIAESLHDAASNKGGMSRDRMET
jgi:hypothetical protein